MSTTVRWTVVTVRRELRDLDKHAAWQRTASAQSPTCPDGPRCGLLGASTRRRWRLGHADQGEDALKNSARRVDGRARVSRMAITRFIHMVNMIIITDIIHVISMMIIMDIIYAIFMMDIICIMNVIDIIDIIGLISIIFMIDIISVILLKSPRTVQ